MTGHLLTLMIVLPLLAAAGCVCAPGTPETKTRSARWIAVAATAIDLLLGIFLWRLYVIDGPRWQFVERADLFGTFSWALGIDGIALMLVLLTVFLMPLCVVASWTSVKQRVPEYMAIFLLTEALMLGAFMAQDLILFYIMFEATLIPMYFIIGIWGGPRRIYASYKFFLYTLLGSVVMFVAMLWMIQEAGTSDIPTLMAHDFPRAAQGWLWLAFFASFAVKLPMWPVHTWLPDAHVEAPTAGSVILAGVMLKLGGYGFVRFSLPMFPQASADYMWLVFALSMIATVYTSLVALVQEDMKKRIAYSSVAHMAIVTFGLFAFNEQGVDGALMLMLGHGIVSGALFLCVGVAYDRLHTRDIGRYGGIAINMPVYAFVFMFFVLASVGLPGLSNFVGEFLAMMGAFQRSTWAGVIAGTAIILSAAYMLTLFRGVFYGAQAHTDAAALPDMNVREKLMLLPLGVVTLWMGAYPESFLAPMRRDAKLVVERLRSVAPVPDAMLTAGPRSSREHGDRK